MAKYFAMNNKDEAKFLTKEEIKNSDEFFQVNPIVNMTVEGMEIKVMKKK